MTAPRGITAAICALFWATGPAVAATTATNDETLPASTRMSEGKPTRAPIGFVRLCLATPDACGVEAALLDERIHVLTDASWQRLADVNADVNARIRPISDSVMHRYSDVWSIDPAVGDCEDYALTKRAALIGHGWPAAALPIAVVRDENGAHHAVLVVRTDRGDFVLDNRRAAILPWSDLPYRWIKAQSSGDPRHWVQLDGYVEEMIERKRERLRRLALH